MHLEPLALLAALASACSDPECDVEDLVARDIAGLDAIECGIHDLGWEDNSPLEEAHECVEEALAGRSTFYVLWRVPGFEGYTTKGWIGRGTDVAYQVVQYHSSADATGNYGTGRTTCSDLTPTEICDWDRLRGKLCLECVDGINQVLCDIDD